MHLRIGRSTNFRGLLPTATLPTTSIPRTAPPTVRMAGLDRARQLIRALRTPTAPATTSAASAPVPARPSISTFSLSTTTNTVTTASSPSSLSHFPSAPSQLHVQSNVAPQELKHAPNVIKLSQYHRAEPASQWWSSSWPWWHTSVLYAALSDFPFYLDTIPRKWYFQLNESI